MKTTPFQRDNHYVPCVYLKNFAGSNQRVSTYRLLVSHSNVPLWKSCSSRSIAFYPYLYTRTTAGGPTDEIEKWLEHDFETPAQDALRKALSDEQLTPADWRQLIRFLAAQDVRTPARLLDNLQRWESDLPSLMDEVLNEAIEELQFAKERGIPLVLPPPNNSDYIPFRLKKEIEPGQAFGMLKSEVIAGRGLWLFSMKRALTQTINVLHQHRWSILKPPNGLSWFTSDDPVIRLNFYQDRTYDFKGGWGNPGTEIFLPLSPHHLLYAKIGEKPPPRGATVDQPQAEMIQRFIAEHAHRMIISAAPDKKITLLRTRVVSRDLFQSEIEQWRKWHGEQTAAERKLMGWGPTNESPDKAWSKT